MPAPGRIALLIRLSQVRPLQGPPITTTVGARAPTLERWSPGKIRGPYRGPYRMAFVAGCGALRIARPPGRQAAWRVCARRRDRVWRCVSDSLPSNRVYADVHASTSEGLADCLQGVALRAKLHDLGLEVPRLARDAARRLHRDKPHVTAPVRSPVHQSATRSSLLCGKCSVPVRMRTLLVHLGAGRFALTVRLESVFRRSRFTWPILSRWIRP
jgi:hypothetical protein